MSNAAQVQFFIDTINSNFVFKKKHGREYIIFMNYAVIKSYIIKSFFA